VLRSNLFAAGYRQQECLIQAGSDECAPISDVGRTEVSGTMSTELAGDMLSGTFGIQYVLNDYRHLDRRTSTLSLSLALRMPLSTFGGF
jgi:hypothetical protein